MSIVIDYSRDSLFDALGLTRLRDSYMREDENSPQDRFAYVSNEFGSNPAHAQRLYDYASKHWLSYSTPILSFGRTPKSQAISCYLNYIHDSASGLVDNLSETNWLSMMGGGVGVHVGIRSSDAKSTGVMSHLKTYDSSSRAYRQGKTRRGSYAAYLDISHPDIIQFLEMRKPTGDPDLRCLNMNHGINIPDKFYEIIERCMYDDTANDDWELVQPNTGEVVEVISAKALWSLILDIRLNTGEPYIWNIDTANKAVPEYQKALGLKTHGSNLCSEISLVTSEDRTAVCCLSSVNAEYYDDWKDDPNFLPDVLEMLDNVLTHFIANAPDEIARAKFSAYRERSVGVGVLGFHAYLQKNRIPFESAMAKSFNIKLFRHIRTQLDAKNLQLALERGSCPDAAEAGYIRRLSHVMAVAPNASTSIILGNTSPSTEPFASNVYIQDTISGAFVTKNKFLDALIKNNNVDYDETWASIIAKRTVQHLDWMDPYDKLIFKTAREIDQQWIIEHASDRQPFIDQAQSLNIYVRPDVDTKYFHHLHYLIWKKGLKSAYYCRSGKMASAEAVGQQVKRVRLEDEIEHENNSVKITYSSTTAYTLEGQGTIELVEASGCIACE